MKSIQRTLVCGRNVLTLLSSKISTPGIQISTQSQYPLYYILVRNLLIKSLISGWTPCSSDRGMWYPPDLVRHPPWSSDLDLKISENRQGVAKVLLFRYSRNVKNHLFVAMKYKNDNTNMEHPSPPRPDHSGRENSPRATDRTDGEAVWSENGCEQKWWWWQRKVNGSRVDRQVALWQRWGCRAMSMGIGGGRLRKEQAAMMQCKLALIHRTRG